jgi:uncharacterized membrane protein (UPF0127 family)
MKSVRLRNETRGNVLCDDCGVADNILTRIRGLLGRKSLPPGQGLLIVPCPSIHMFGMKFAIDAVFITRDNVVTDFIENIAPGKMYVARAHHGKAHAAIELPSGAIAASGLQRGDQLSAEPKDAMPP